MLEYVLYSYLWCATHAFTGLTEYNTHYTQLLFTWFCDNITIRRR